MKVSVVWASAALQDVVALDLAPGATAADAAARSGLAAAYGFDAAQCTLAVFGRRVAPDDALADGDRVEITRPLVADPKDVRRLRARRAARLAPPDEPSPHVGQRRARRLPRRKPE